MLAAVAAALAVRTRTRLARSPSHRLGLAPPAGAGPVLAVTSAGAAAAVVALAHVPVAGATLLATGGGALALHRRRRAARRLRAAEDADALALCFALACDLRGGRIPAEALEAAAGQLGPLAPGVAGVARAVARGAPPAEEIAGLAHRVGSTRLGTIAAVWSAGTDIGVGIAAVLDRVGAAFASADAARAELDALAAGPRATALVLCALPLFAIALGTAAGAAPVALLAGTPAGWLLTVGAGVLDAAGVLWVRAVTGRALAR